MMVGILLCMLAMLSSLVEVTRRDAMTLAKRRIHSAGALSDRKLASVSRNRQKRKMVVNWCHPLGLKAAPGRITALASFPGSGNTWLRYLLQQVTGVATGSIYRDAALRRNGFPAESIANGSVIAVKTHEWGAQARETFDSAILLVRDPFDSILAEFNRRAGGHIGHASKEKFVKDHGRMWQQFVISKAGDWEEFYTDWLENFKCPLLIVSYADLVRSVETELQRVLDFLEVSVTSNSMKCAISRQEGIYRRQKTQLNLKDSVFDKFLTNVVSKRKDRVFAMIKSLRS